MNGLNLKKEEIKQQLAAFDYLAKRWAELRSGSKRGCILLFLNEILLAISPAFHEWSETIVDAAIIIVKSTAPEGFEKMLYTTPIDWKDEYNHRAIEAIKASISKGLSLRSACFNLRTEIEKRDRDLKSLYWSGIEYDKYYTDAALCAIDLTLVGPKANLGHSPLPDAWD